MELQEVHVSGANAADERPRRKQCQERSAMQAVVTQMIAPSCSLAAGSMRDIASTQSGHIGEPLRPSRARNISKPSMI